MKRSLLQSTESVEALSPQSISGSSAVDGTIIDLTLYPEALSILVGVQAAAASGSPTSYTYALKIQTGLASDGSDMADFITLDTMSVADPTKTLANWTEADIVGASRYIRVVLTPTFAAGTDPAAVSSAIAVLGDFEMVPPTGSFGLQLNGQGFSGYKTVHQPAV